jgi:hypothetical protein
MTEYGHQITTLKPTPLLSHDQVKEKKEARRKLIDQVEQRRRWNYREYYKKLHEKASIEI